MFDNEVVVDANTCVVVISDDDDTIVVNIVMVRWNSSGIKGK